MSAKVWSTTALDEELPATTNFVLKENDVSFLIFQAKGIYRYNSVTANIKKIMQYPPIASIEAPIASFGPTKDTVFVWDGKMSIFAANVKSERFTSAIKLSNVSKYDEVIGARGIMFYNIQGTRLHLVGGENQARRDYQLLVHLDDDVDRHGVMRQRRETVMRGEYYPAGVALKSPGLVAQAHDGKTYLFGGTNKYCKSCRISDGVVVFDASGKYKLLKRWKLPLPLYGMGVAFIEDRFLLIAGGYTRYQQATDDIYILDIKNRSRSNGWKKSALVLPSKGTYSVHSACSKNARKMLLCGCIRKWNIPRQVTSNIPEYLQDWISKFIVRNDIVHFFAANSKSIHTIRLNELLKAAGIQ